MEVGPCICLCLTSHLAFPFQLSTDLTMELVAFKVKSVFPHSDSHYHDPLPFLALHFPYEQLQLFCRFNYHYYDYYYKD